MHKCVCKDRDAGKDEKLARPELLVGSSGGCSAAGRQRKGWLHGAGTGTPSTSVVFHGRSVTTAGET